MASYGTLVIQDGVYQTAQDARFRNAPVRMDFENPMPPVRVFPKPGLTTFVVELNYEQNANIFGIDGVAPLRRKVEFSRRFARIASDRNPVSDAKKFLGQFVSCEEASKLRRRIIALSRMKNSISDEVFRFGIDAP